MNLADAKAHFSELVNRAAAGETIPIVRRGRVVARLAPPEPAKAKVDVASLRRSMAGAERAPEPGTTVRHMRDTDRY